uniref:Uncharacterized protein n=1 Tax=Panagrellus redivivus TaxID=6233 RepID=A0A7E4VJ34_PANRE
MNFTLWATPCGVGSHSGEIHHVRATTQGRMQVSPARVAHAQVEVFVEDKSTEETADDDLKTRGGAP